MRLAVWCEFLPYRDVIPLLGQLSRRELALHLAVQPSRAADPFLWELLRAARDEGIEVRAWVLLSPEEGYWPGACNAARWAEAALSLTAAADDRGTPLAWVIADLEPPPERMRALAERLTRRDLHGVWRELRKGPGSAPEAAALPEAVRRLRRQGVRVQAVTLPLALDGECAGRFLSCLGIPRLEDIPWDEVTFMVYRPEFIRLCGPVSADLVARYSCDAADRFAGRASLAIGEVGTPGYPAPVPGYLDPAELQADLAACRAAGLAAVSIYSLEGIGEQGGLARWLDAPSVEAPRSEPKAGLIRLALAAACWLVPG